MQFHVLTLFPEFFESPLQTSILGRAIRNNLIQVECTDIRDFAENRHHRVDDVPFGGGGGMVMQVGPAYRALEHVRQSNPDLHTIYLSPKGKTFHQQDAERLSHHRSIGLLCGHYEGIDARIERHVDEQISLGDYVLTGGEPGALILMDAIARLREGVLGNPDSWKAESHTTDPLLEHPHYTRPRTFLGEEVPEVLLSGNHGAIESWRREQAILETWKHRPELLSKCNLSGKENAFLEGWIADYNKKAGKKT